MLAVVELEQHTAAHRQQFGWLSMKRWMARKHRMVRRADESRAEGGEPIEVGDDWDESILKGQNIRLVNLARKNMFDHVCIKGR